MRKFLLLAGPALVTVMALAGPAANAAPVGNGLTGLSSQAAPAPVEKATYGRHGGITLHFGGGGHRWHNHRGWRRGHYGRGHRYHNRHGYYGHGHRYNSWRGHGRGYRHW
jgi:hypothetical protein